MINRHTIIKYYSIKICIIIFMVFLYMVLNTASVSFLFAAFSITITKAQAFMIVVGSTFLSHRVEVYDHKHQHNLRLYIHDKLLRSFGSLIKSVLFLFISFGYLVYLS